MDPISRRSLKVFLRPRVASEIVRCRQNSNIVQQYQPAMTGEHDQELLTAADIMGEWNRLLLLISRCTQRPSANNSREKEHDRDRLTREIFF